MFWVVVVSNGLGSLGHVDEVGTENADETAIWTGFPVETLAVQEGVFEGELDGAHGMGVKGKSFHYKYINIDRSYDSDFISERKGVAIST